MQIEFDLPNLSTPEKYPTNWYINEPALHFDANNWAFGESICEQRPELKDIFPYLCEADQMIVLIINTFYNILVSGNNYYDFHHWKTSIYPGHVSNFNVQPAHRVFNNYDHEIAACFLYKYVYYNLSDEEIKELLLNCYGKNNSKKVFQLYEQFLYFDHVLSQHKINETQTAHDLFAEFKKQCIANSQKLHRYREESLELLATLQHIDENPEILTPSHKPENAQSVLSQLRLLGQSLPVHTPRNQLRTHKPRTIDSARVVFKLKIIKSIETISKYVAHDQVLAAIDEINSLKKLLEQYHTAQDILISTIKDLEILLNKESAEKPLCSDELFAVLNEEDISHFRHIKSALLKSTSTSLTASNTYDIWGLFTTSTVKKMTPESRKKLIKNFEMLFESIGISTKLVEPPRLQKISRPIRLFEHTGYFQSFRLVSLPPLILNFKKIPTSLNIIDCTSTDYQNNLSTKSQAPMKLDTNLSQTNTFEHGDTPLAYTTIPFETFTLDIQGLTHFEYSTPPEYNQTDMQWKKPLSQRLQILRERCHKITLVNSTSHSIRLPYGIIDIKSLRYTENGSKVYATHFSVFKNPHTGFIEKISLPGNQKTLQNIEIAVQLGSDIQMTSNQYAKAQFQSRMPDSFDDPTECGIPFGSQLYKKLLEIKQQNPEIHTRYASVVALLKSLPLAYGYTNTQLPQLHKRQCEATIKNFEQQGKGICQDFSRLFMSMCQFLEIPCTYHITTSKTGNTLYSNSTHQSCIVMIDDEIIYFDPTMGFKKKEPSKDDLNKCAQWFTPHDTFELPHDLSMTNTYKLIKLQYYQSLLQSTITPTPLFITIIENIRFIPPHKHDDLAHIVNRLTRRNNDQQNNKQDWHLIYKSGYYLSTNRSMFDTLIKVLPETEKQLFQTLIELPIYNENVLTKS